MRQRANVKIFIADDSVAVRQGLALVLSMVPGAEVVGEAPRGREAVAAIRRLMPDVVILDLHLPELNGLEVLAAIKSDRPALVVIMFTASPSHPLKTRCLQA